MPSLSRISTLDAVRAKAGLVVRPLRPAPKGLRKPAPVLLPVADVPLFGDAENGQELREGRFRFGGQGVDIGSGHPFGVTLPSERFAGHIHDFDWLPDLLSVPGGGAVASSHLRDWSQIFPVTGRNINAFVMAPDRLAARMVNWGAALSYIDDTDGAITDSYARQMHRLRARMSDGSPGLDSLRAHAAMVMFGARQAKDSDWRQRGLDGLDAQLSAQILPDGGHISRSPAATAEVLRLLLIVDYILGARSVAGSNALSRAIDRTAPMVQTLRHSDGRLGVFHGGGEGNAAQLDALMAAAPGDPQAFAFGPHTGFHAISAGDARLLIDVGDVPRRPFDTRAHLAPLAMELSTTEGRLIVNCGASPGLSPAWRQPVRAAAAHSTLILDDLSPGRLLEPGFRADMLGPAVLSAPGGVRARRKEQASGIWLESSHDGYKQPYGLVHRRRIFMGEDGDDIRGEDSLFVPVGEAPVRRDQIPFSVRFHFHPDVRVSLAQDLSSALLVQNGRAGWRFRTDAGPLSVEPSVYLGGSSRPVRAQQLVIRGQAFGDSDGTNRDNCVRWSLRELKRRDMRRREGAQDRASDREVQPS